jgi:hypothetical protein
MIGPERFETPAVRAHLAEIARLGIGLPVASPERVPRIPDDLARLILRAEEYEHAHRDQWGNWEYGSSENFRRGRLWEPEVDVWLAARRAELSTRAELQPLWPDHHRFAVCLTHDVDLIADRVTPRQTARSVRTAWPRSGASGRSRVEAAARSGVRALRGARRVAAAPAASALERCARIEHENGVTASYFFTVFPGAGASRFDCVYMPDDACTFRGERMSVAELIRALASDGFDIGLHGSFRSATDDGRLVREKETLERATGLVLTTTRQHFLRWDVRLTPRIQLKAGLSADATMGFNRNLGFRAGTTLPFRHFDLEGDEPLDLLIVPLAIHDTPLFRPDGLELDLELAREAVRTVIDAIAAVQGTATFLIHPNNLLRSDDEALFRWIITYARDRGAWFASLRDVDRWCRERQARLMTP